MDVNYSPIPVPEVKFQNRSHPGYKGMVDDIARPRDNPYYLLWRRSPVWTRTPVKQYDAQSSWSQQVGVSKFVGVGPPRVNIVRSFMTPRSGLMPRVIGVQGDETVVAGEDVEDSKYFNPTTHFSTANRDQPRVRGHMTQVARQPWRFANGFGGPSNPVVSK